MNEKFFDCLKRERDICIKPKLRDGKSAFRYNPTLISNPSLVYLELQISVKHLYVVIMIEIVLLENEGFYMFVLLLLNTVP